MWWQTKTLKPLFKSYTEDYIESVIQLWIFMVHRDVVNTLRQKEDETNYNIL